MLHLSLFIKLLTSVAVAATVPSNVLFEKTSGHLSKRATCVPKSAGNAGTDDVPAIEAAIASCGDGGIIQIPAGKTYMIRSVLDFAGCSNCDF